MSVKIMSRIWEESTQKANKLLLLLAIADNANDDGWAFPAHSTLAKKCRVGRRAVQKMLDELETEKEVVIYNRVAEPESQQHFSNVYHLSKYSDNPGAKYPNELRGKLKIRVIGSVSPDTTVVSPETHESLQESSVELKDSATTEKVVAHADVKSEEAVTLPKEKSAYTLLVESVSIHFFRIDPSLISAEKIGGHVGIIAGWLNGTSAPKGMSKISHAASPKHVESFAKWWDKNKTDPRGNPLTRPTKPSTFIEFWRAWATQIITKKKENIEVEEDTPVQDWSVNSHTWYLDEDVQSSDKEQVTQ